MNSVKMSFNGLRRLRSAALLLALAGLISPTFLVTRSVAVPPAVLLSQATVPPRPEAVPEPNEPEMSGIMDLAEAETSLGIGYLRPEDISFLDNPEDNASQLEAGWLQTIELPLYITPDGDHWGWLLDGWLIPNGQSAFAIGRDASFAMVRVQPSLLAFPVLEVRDDGWVRVQYTATGSAWAHTSHLALGDQPLVFEPWGDWLSSSKQLKFRTEDNAQVLRSQPELSRNVITLVRNDSLIEPLEVDGDWIRVRVTRPVSGCEPLSGANIEEGWMRWRSDEGEMTMWQATESCQ
ncbi:MAG: hypothetical protein AAF921_09460 [Cyanobacteria bacterium P01_D01_bin.44]